ncbi:hypothetical protein GOP47_0028433 [Adiantum capillus-veneris]|nr:hypothetical protein GOP47_0028433 [Adiantum capillus-veneris]
MACWHAFLAFLLLLESNESVAYVRHDAFIGYSEINIGRPPRPPSVQAQEYLFFTTAYGAIKVRLFVHQAPQAVNYIKSLLASGSTLNGCFFYRAEPPGETVDTGSPGSRKGYALVQGGFCGTQSATTLPVESEMANAKGTVSLIMGTKDFFFSLEDHLEWNGSFTAWGEITGEKSWEVLKTIVALPTRQQRHPTGTVMRMLLKEVTFSVSLQKF